MSSIHVMKTPGGAFVPATEADVEAIARFKVGRVQKVEITEMRNGTYFRKWWVLAKFAFDLWAETTPEHAYKGIPVLPDFERFRKDLTIMAGFFRPVWDAEQELRLEAESLAWGSMSQERFEKLYSATINAVLQKIIPNANLTEESLRRTVDELLMGFDR